MEKYAAILPKKIAGYEEEIKKKIVATDKVNEEWKKQKEELSKIIHVPISPYNPDN